MGSEVAYWVEIEVCRLVWVKSEGTTGDLAAQKVADRLPHRLTGRTSSSRPTYPDLVDEMLLDIEE